MPQVWKISVVAAAVEELYVWLTWMSGAPEQASEACWASAGPAAARVAVQAISARVRGDVMSEPPVRWTRGPGPRCDAGCGRVLVRAVGGSERRERERRANHREWGRTLVGLSRVRRSASTHRARDA